MNLEFHCRVPTVLICLIAILHGSPAFSDEVQFHPASAMIRIGGTEGVIPPLLASYDLEMVRGEREGLQVAILPSGKTAIGIQQVQVHSKAKNAPQAALFRVLPVHHTTPTEDKIFHVPSRRLGLIPDVLMPMEQRSHEATAIPTKEGEVPLTYYIEFTSLTETPVEVYSYEFTVESQGKIHRLTVQVRVLGVTLPDRFPFRTAICWDHTLKKYFDIPMKPEDKKAFWNFCLDHRLSPAAFYGSEPDPSPSEAIHLKARGLSGIFLMKLNRSKPTLLTPEQKEKIKSQIPQWRDDLEKAGLLGDAFVFLADEPAESVDPTPFRENAKWLKEQFPEVKFWACTQPKSPWNEFVDVFGVVTAHSSEFYRPHSHDEKLRRSWTQPPIPPGREYWWFHSVEPYAPYANLRLDNLPVEARVIGWQNAQYRVDGYEYFWIAGWDQNLENRDVPWPQRAEQWKTGLSGAGTLCYPDEQKRPMPSLRLVNLRDGLEDWALIEMLYPRNKPKECPLLSPVTRSLTDFTTDPAKIQDTRKKIIQELISQKSALSP